MTDPADVVITDFGVLKIYVGNTDVTYLANPHDPTNQVPTEINQWGSQEPFGDDACTLVFHGVSARNIYGGLRPTGTGSVSWLYDWAPVQIKVELPPDDDDHQKVITLWEGNIASFDDELTQTDYSVTATCTGSFYQMNTSLHPPAFNDDIADIAQLFDAEIALQADVYRCGLNYLPQGGTDSAGRELSFLRNCFDGLAGVDIRKTGAWDPVVSGWMASVLGMAYTSPLPNGLCIGIATPNTFETEPGYWVLSTDGLLLEWNQAPYFGCVFAGAAVGLTDQEIGQDYEPDGQLAAPITGLCSTLNSPGYWLVAEDGGVFAFGGAQFFGSYPGLGSPLLSRNISGEIVSTFSSVINSDQVYGTDLGARVQAGSDTNGNTYLPAIMLGEAVSANYIQGIDAFSSWNISSTRVLETDVEDGYASDPGNPGNQFEFTATSTDGTSTLSFGEAIPQLLVNMTVTGAGITGLVTVDDVDYDTSTVTVSGAIGTLTDSAYSFFGPPPTPVTDFDIPGGITISDIFVGIAGTGDDQGYHICSIKGAVYSFGDASYHGGMEFLTSGPGEGSLAGTINGVTNVLSSGAVVGFCLSPGQTGYLILTSDGFVYGFGDAASIGFDNTGNTLGASLPFSGISVDPINGGYSIVTQFGEVYSLHGAANHGNSPTGLAGPITGIDYLPTQAGYYLVGSDGGVFALGDAPFYGSVVDGSARQNQWTIAVDPGVSNDDGVALHQIAPRRPYMILKDRWSVHYTYECGQEGVTHSLTRDLTSAPNAMYGEGIWPITNYVPIPGQLDLTSPVEYLGQWRNTIYPLQQIIAPPVFPLTPPAAYGIGATGPDVQMIQQQLFKGGYTTVRTDGIYDQNTANVVTAFQIAAGLTVSGTITSQTWAAAYNVGGGGSIDPNAPGADQPYFAPLSIDPLVAPYLVNADGSTRLDGSGNPFKNPNFDARKRRVEHYENFGNYISKQMGLSFAGGERRNYSKAPWIGTLAIDVDNTSRHRLQMRAGMNISYTNFQGASILLHVTKVSVDQNNRVTATVDSAFRDSTYVDAILDGNRALNDPDKRPQLTTYLTGITKDITAAFDAENGGGRVYPHVLAAKEWFVYRVPVGAVGDIVHTEFYTDPPTEFSIGIFPQLVTPAFMANLFSATVSGDTDDEGHPIPDPGNPLGLLESGQNPWDIVPISTGLLVAWGWNGSAAGFWPLTDPGDGSLPPTGILVDDSDLTYQTINPPWLYIAEYSLLETTMHGQLYPTAPTF